MKSPLAVRTDHACGIVPVYGDARHEEFLLVQHRKGHWGFPKGHPDPGESPVETAVRELAEETGLRCTQILADAPFLEHYNYLHPRGHRVIKTVTFFIGFVEDRAVHPDPGEIAGYCWGDFSHTRQRLTFDQGRVLLDEVQAYLRKVRNGE